MESGYRAAPIITVAAEEVSLFRAVQGVVACGMYAVSTVTGKLPRKRTTAFYFVDRGETNSGMPDMVADLCAYPLLPSGHSTTSEEGQLQLHVSTTYATSEQTMGLVG